MLREILFALRLFRRTPLLTGTALVSIALGVGATAVVFAAIKSVLLNPLPYSHANELVQFRSVYADAPSHTDWIFWNDTQEIIPRTRTLGAVGVYSNAVFDLGANGSTAPEALYGIRMTAALFPTLGVSPMLGRNILPEEDQLGHVEEMILSYGLWDSRFHHDRSIVGKSIQVNGRACVVVGVMPPDFNFPLRRGATRTRTSYVQFWASLRAWEPVSTTAGMGAVARLRPGVSLKQAEDDLATIDAALVHDLPSTNRDHTLRLGLLADRNLGSARRALWFLMAAALLFLLIGCANVANLLLARGFVRQREMAVRMAIGASRWRILRQLLTESCILAVVGGLGGYALTVLAWRVLPAIAPATIPKLANAHADWPIFAFALALSLVNGILFGLAPAFRSAATGTIGARGAASGKQDRIRASLVMAEVAVTVMLVVVGARLLGSFLGLIQTDSGFQADRVLASVILPARERYATAEKRAAIYKRFLDSVRALPGVEKAGTVDALPFSGENHGGEIHTDSTSKVIAEVDVIGGDYLQALGVRLIAGRWFREEETDAAIINDHFARRLWPGDDAVGKRICVYCTPESPNNWTRVVGVVSSIHHASLDEGAPENVYLSAGAMENAAFLVVKSGRPMGELSNAIRRAVASIDPNQPVLLSASLRSLVDDSVADRRFITTLLTITGCLGLLMSAAGVYGVTSYVTSRRTQEIGLRMALGATPGGVLALVFQQGFAAVGIGLLAGGIATVVIMPLLRGVLAGLETERNGYFMPAACVVVLFTGAACWIPARRAMKIDPMDALRQE